MLKQFKKFADYINSKRREREFDFEQIVRDEAERKEVYKILEVGSNIRPILSKSPNYQFHGIDPDPDIDLKEANEIFDEFFNETIEDFKTENKYDLIVIHMVLEHLENNAIVFKKIKSLLSEDGKLLLHIPSNLHPFTVVNRILPHNLKVKVLKTFRPWAGVGVITGWRSYYDKCNTLGMKKLAKDNNLKVTKIYTDYNASDYFAFFPPLFLLVVGYEETVRFLKIPVLCAYLAMEIQNSGEKD